MSVHGYLINFRKIVLEHEYMDTTDRLIDFLRVIKLELCNEYHIFKKIKKKEIPI